MNNTNTMNKKQLYTTPELEVVMIRFEQNILSASVASGTTEAQLQMSAGTFGDGSGEWD